MSAFAVIKTGGKQYRVVEDDVLVIERLLNDEGEPLGDGDAVVFDQVLMLGGEGDSKIGAPMVAGAAVTAEVLEQRRAKKITIIKTRQRNTYQRKMGHRQNETVVRITGISADGAPAPKKKAASKAKKPAEAATVPAAPAGDVQAPFLAAPNGEPDDLKKLDGVGPAAEKKFHAAGIFHFHQIAGFTAEDIAKAEETLGAGKFEKGNWVAQAGELASGS